MSIATDAYQKVAEKFAFLNQLPNLTDEEIKTNLSAIQEVYNDEDDIFNEAVILKQHLCTKKTEKISIKELAYMRL